MMRENYLPLTSVALVLGSWLGASAQESVDVARSAGISRVYEYRPAPGQFQNVMPEYEDGDTEETMRLKAEELLKEGGMVSLGAFGGYVVMGFDHMVENRVGRYDLQILGNSYPEEGAEAGSNGSSEPAVVYVSYDANGNGLPDDEWYELAGSEYGKTGTWYNYSVTYHRMPEGHVGVPGLPGIVDAEYIRWTDSEGGEGYLAKNAYHAQEYWPLWMDGKETLTFTGTRLAPNGEDVKGDGSYYRQKAYAWGYADSMPNDEDASKLDLQWAVDKDGRPANLPGVHFVKVQTSVLQSNGWIGECSSEVAGAVDLHLAGGDVASTDGNLKVLTFEDEDYGGDATKTDYWSSLVDNPQYGGVLLYGESGAGVTALDEAYSWYDKGNTELASTINNSWGAWAYWNGGMAVSDYVGSALENVSYTEQLTVYASGSETGRGAGGYGASDHFAVINGTDNTPSGGVDSRAVLSFPEGQTGIVEYAYVAPTTYFLSNVVNGSATCAPAKEGTFVDLVVEGYDVQGVKTSAVSLRLVDGLRHVDRWTWLDLSALGRVHSVRFGFQASEDQVGQWGLNTPAYVAIDNIAVLPSGDASGIRDIATPAAKADGKMYDLTGRELREGSKGSIIIVNGKKVVF